MFNVPNVPCPVVCDHATRVSQGRTLSASTGPLPVPDVVGRKHNPYIIMHIYRSRYVHMYRLLKNNIKHIHTLTLNRSQ